MDVPASMSRSGPRRTIAPLAALAALLFAPPSVGAETVFALVDTGELFASDDQAATWSVRSALPVPDAVGLVAGTSSNDLFLTSGTGTVYTSIDAGMTWNASGALTASDVVALHIRPDGDLLVLTRSGLVFESPDATSFAAVSSLTASNMVSLSRRPGPVYALAETGEVSRSDDDGGSWTTVGAVTASDAVEIVSLVNDVFVITSTGDVWTSDDAGASWNAVATLSQVHTSGLVRSFAGTFYATTLEGEIARSTDGMSWSWVGTTNQLNVVALATDEAIVAVPPAGGGASSLFVGVPTPNPLGGTGAIIGFEIAAAAAGRLEVNVFDASGRRILGERRFIEEGTSRISTDVSRLGSGVYFARLSVGREGVSRRFVVAR